MPRRSAPPHANHDLLAADPSVVENRALKPLAERIGRGQLDGLGRALAIGRS